MKFEWISSDHELIDVLAEIQREDRYALDTEFHREKTYFPQLALIQLKWGKQIALVDPLAVTLSQFGDLFRSSALCVVHAAQQDLEVLNYACGTAPNKIFDTQVAAGFIGMSSPSLSTLVQNELKVTLTKGDRLTDWLRRPLTSNQCSYAATDVEYLLSLHDILEKKLEALGRTDWVIGRPIIARRCMVKDQRSPHTEGECSRSSSISWTLARSSSDECQHSSSQGAVRHGSTWYCPSSTAKF